MKLYDMKAMDIDGKEISMEEYKGKILLIVNTASKCGFTPQYKDLQKIYDKYEDKDFEILGFPCNQFMDQEPGNNNEIKTFCELNYGVTFPIFEKINVNGSSTHELFKFLKENSSFEGFDMSNPTNKILDAMIKEKFPEFHIGNAIRWNFTKFLVDQEGNVVKRFEPTEDFQKIELYIKNLLK